MPAMTDALSPATPRSSTHTTAPSSDAQAYTCLTNMYGMSPAITSRSTPPPTPVTTPTNTSRNAPCSPHSIAAPMPVTVNAPSPRLSITSIEMSYA